METTRRSSGWGGFRVPVLLVLLSGCVLAGYRPASAASAYSASAVNTFANVALVYGQSADGSKIVGRNIVPVQQMRAVVASGATSTQLDPVNGFTHSVGHGVNNAGQAVGYLSNNLHGFNAADRGFVYTSGTVTQLPTLGTTGYTHAYGINNGGTIVGRSDSRPYKTAVGDAALTALPTIVAISTAGTASSINAAGDIVGWLGTSTPAPVVWPGAGGVSALALPAGATSGMATYIDDTGAILGSARYGAAERAVRYDPNGAALDLGAFAGGYSEARDVNSVGQIVGFSRINGSPNFDEAAFLYENGQMLNLNNLLQGGSGWVLRRAISINDAGEIFGLGTFNNVATSFKLTPVPEPTGGLIAGMAIACSIARRRRVG